MKLHIDNGNVCLYNDKRTDVLYICRNRQHVRFTVKAYRIHCISGIIHHRTVNVPGVWYKECQEGHRSDRTILQAVIW